jgi:hypothetical protein
MHIRERIRHKDKAASRLAPKGGDARFDISVVMNERSDWHNLDGNLSGRLRMDAGLSQTPRPAVPGLPCLALHTLAARASGR